MKSDSTLTNDDVLRRVQGEYLEMPGLRLTEAQARRLWGLDDASCAALLKMLVDAKFLRVSADGRYARLTDGEMSSRRSARAVDVESIVYRPGARE